MHMTLGIFPLATNILTDSIKVLQPGNVRPDEVDHIPHQANILSSTRRSTC